MASRAVAQEDSSAVESDYEYYVAGCIPEDIKPLSRGRFDVMFGVYLTQGAYDRTPLFRETLRQRYRRVVRQARLMEVGRLTKLGYELKAEPYPHRDAPSLEVQWRELVLKMQVPPSSDELPPDDDPHPDPPPSASDNSDDGVRVPRDPRVPVLIGAAARAMPKPGEERYIVPWHY